MTDMEGPVLGVEEIKSYIPHRYPFLYLDRVEAIVPKQSAIGVKNVTINEPFFQGHFPGKPVMPGVLIVEALAQTAGVMVGYSLDLGGTGSLVYFMSVDGCKFRKMVLPGDSLRLNVEVIRQRGKVWKFKGEATVAGELATECEFAAMIAPPPEA